MDQVPEIFIILIDRLKVNLDNGPNILEKVSGIKMTLKEQNVAKAVSLCKTTLRQLQFYDHKFLKEVWRWGRDHPWCAENVCVLYNEG